MIGCFQIVFPADIPFAEQWISLLPLAGKAGNFSLHNSSVLNSLQPHKTEKGHGNERITHRQPENLFKLSVKDPGITPRCLNSKSISLTKRPH